MTISAACCRLWNSWKADIADAQSLSGLAERLDDPNRVRAFYLATPPDRFIPASRALKSAGLLEGGTRLVLEKPLGQDLASARAINEAVAAVLPESQTYRIDHYLGKETVQNLLVLRFANTLFERSWSERDIDHVQITVAETVGLEARAGYYDKIGALRDMVQNHVLQLLCLFAIEPPNMLTADAIRDEKVRVLRALKPITGAEVLHKTVRGQYMRGSLDGAPVPGYSEELGRESGTETFVALRCELETWRWAGCSDLPAHGQAHGLALFGNRGHIPEIAASHLSWAGGCSGGSQPARHSPPANDGLQLQMMMKVPGSGRLKLVPRVLDLRYDTAFDERTPDAYERLLTDVIRGDQTLFMRRDEVETAWSFIDPIVEGWKEHYTTPHRYVAGTTGPAQAVALIEREGRSWSDPELRE